MIYKYRVIIALIASIFLVQMIYIGIIDPGVDEILILSQEKNTVLPRNIFIFLMDFEQKACLILFIWGGYLCYDQLQGIGKSSFVYKVDLMKDIVSRDLSLEKKLDELESISEEIRVTPVVTVLTTSLRRFLLTKNIDSAADAVSTSLEVISIKHNNDLAIIKYIAWAIPSIGFIGTVRGIGMAMAQAEVAVAGDIGPMTQSLGLAFNSTFVALLISILLMLMLSFVQRSQEDEILKIQEYCEKNLLNRLSKKEI